MALPTKKTPADFTFKNVGQVDQYGVSVGGNINTVQSNLDSRAIDNQDEINLLIDALNSQTVGDSGAKAVKTELSDVQTELDSTVRTSGNQSISGTKTFNGVVNFLDVCVHPSPPSNIGDITNKEYVDTKTGKALNETITGSWDFDSNVVFNNVVPNCSEAPTLIGDLTNKSYVDTQVATKQDSTSLELLTTYLDTNGDFGTPGETHNMIDIGSLNENDPVNVIFTVFGTYSNNLLISDGGTHLVKKVIVPNGLTNAQGNDVAYFTNYTILKRFGTYYIMN